ncbi:alpha/beta hydrolase [Streptomyces colonosanans]|uniref:Alpha/beta hydrolase n=1 Tax=Streptomyces colonosanans TaxID=1428652 RepID=A0A1S2PXU2_9ACTN|nr:alpha/beta hydrolase [Streptomyces colonosanans]OIJ98402.1 alpha/beta hydrolase [Streptomyces colonosanans]
MLSMRRRRAIATAAATTAVLALLGTALPSAVAAGGDRDLSRFYRQKISWSACKGEGMPRDLQCGKVTVPLDYARPSAGTLDLALARFPATGGSRGSVLLNFGGPGRAGVSQLASAGLEFMDLAKSYDLVTFDPRGVGRSSPVSCGEDTDGTTGTTGVPAEESDPRAALQQMRKLAEQCARHSGPVLAHMGTVDASRDLDVMRQALGDKKLNYLGFSYGTRLGAVYAAQFPTKVGRMVLDGVDTLTEPLAEQGLAGARGQQIALEDFLAWCVKNVACPFGQDARSAREQVVRLVDSLDRNPVPTALGLPFSGQDLVDGIGQALFSERLWPALEQALSRLVEKGDPGGIMRFSSGALAVPSARETGGGLVDPADVPDDNLPAALMAVNCADDPDRPSADRIVQDLPRLRSRYEEASPVFGPHRLSQVLMCYGRPPGTDFIRKEVKDVHTAKMLLVGTRGDPATPYRWTLETARRLGPSAVVLDNKGEGHTGYTSSRCVHAKVDAFLLDGTLPADGSTCGSERPH